MFSFRKVLHVLVELLLGYLRIDLGGLYALVPQHGTHRFNGHAVGEEHRRGCRVTALVPRDMLRDAATFGNGTYFVQTGHVVGDGKYPSVLTQSPVLVDNPFGDVKQTDIGNHARFLTVDVDPLVVVEVGSDIFLREIAHIGEGQARECAKQVEVAVKFLLGVLQFPFHQLPYFVFRQEAACRFLLFDFVLPERVAREPLVVDGDEHHRPERAYVKPHGIGTAMLVRAEEHLEVGDECGRKLLQGDVLHMIADIEKLLQVLVHRLVLGKRGFGFHACSTCFS